MKYKSCEERNNDTENALVVIEAENRDGHRVSLELTKNQICYDGFRKLNGEYFRGTPKRNHADCFNYCKKLNC